jgi:Subtilase family/Bacterial Ig-like domain (group 3)/Autotransporter beta-domain/IPT/TIG domain
VAIHKRVCTIRAACLIVVALIASVAGASRDAQAQTRALSSVTSIAPNSGPAAGGTSVTITGTSFTGVTAVKFGGTAATSFTVNSATSITATSPAGSGTVDVTVTNSGGTSATSSADRFTYVSAPSVTSIAPNSGPAAGGTSVTITGTSFTAATALKFGGTAATSFTVNGATSITATSPAGSGTVDVTVTNSGGTSATSSADRFTYGLVTTAAALSSSKNPSSFGQSVIFTAKVTGFSPTGAVTFFDSGIQIGTGTLAAGTAALTTSSLAVGSHSITAKYGGDSNNVASTSAALTQQVGVPTDSIKLREMQISVTPIVAQISGQAIVGAVDSAIDAGFNDDPTSLLPNGGGFTFHIALDQPEANISGTRAGAGHPANARGDGGDRVDAGSLANGRQGGNGAPPGTRLIDLPVLPLPPGSGMPLLGETRFSPDEVMLQTPSEVTSEQIAGIAQRFGLSILTQQTIGMLGRTVYTFRITNGRSVREVIRVVEAARLNAAVQPNYTYGLTQDRSDPKVGLGDPAQYIVKKFHLADAHRITQGDNVVIAVIDSEIDSNQPDLVGRVTNRFDAGCGASSADAHGTGMAGAIASHVHLLGVAPHANIIAICAFGGAGQPKASSFKIIKGLDYAIQHGARIVNMSFAGPPDPALSQALQIAREKGVLLIAAAGNNGPKSSPLYPGADRSVMAVTATDENNQLFKYANQGKYVTVAAPGVDILVPAPEGGLQFTTGTSVATANVSGVAALLLAHKPSLKPEEIRDILVRTAQHLGAGGINPQFGAGLVDLLKALELVVSEKPATEQDSVKRLLASFDASGSRVDDDFSAIGFAAADRTVTKVPSPAAPSRNWLAWIDVRGTDFSRNTFGSDLSGTQVNAIAGLTHKLMPNFLVGAFGGYETFDYTSTGLNGRLKGNGWTVGSYLGWKILPTLRFDVTAAYSGIGFEGLAGTAQGNFSGNRWLVASGLTGLYKVNGFDIEPSAKIYGLWENENAYTDSLGTAQGGRNFVTGRISDGIQVAYPFNRTSSITLMPFVGLYGDYYFNNDNATLASVAPLASTPILLGWSARVTTGLSARFSNGVMTMIGGEYGGIGSNTQIWTFRGRSSVPF